MEYNSTLGAAFLGQFAAAILYGITSLQTLTYYKLHGRDPQLLRYLVFVIWILDSLHIALITYSLYYYVVLKFGDPLAILEPSWGIMAMIMVSNVSNSIVRGVFSHRLWKLSRAMILPLLIGVLSLYIAADGFYFAIRGLQIKSYYDIHHFSWSLYVGFAFEVLTDGMTTVSQCLLLRRLRTGIRCTDSVIAILIVYSINTGLFTSICAILCLATYIVFPYGFIYFAFYFMLSKLYVNSLLANLNARATILERISPAPCAVTLDKGTVSDNVSSPDSSRLWPKSVQFTSVVDPISLTSTCARESIPMVDCGVAG